MSHERSVAIIGGGVLGVCVAYWLSSLYEMNVALIEKENSLAQVTTKRNTGVIHRPFYLNPEKKRVFAAVSQLSYPLWKELAVKFHLPWVEVGTLELALREEDLKVIDNYSKWATHNGMQENEFSILDNESTREIEPAVRAKASFLSRTDTVTDFESLAKAVAEIAENRGCRIIKNLKVKGLRESQNGTEIELQNQDDLHFDFVINLAGGNSLKFAHQIGLGMGCSQLYFRGEYYKIDETFGIKFKHNIYTVPEFHAFPFLDPHLIIRHTGVREIGPNAVMVTGPESYDGFIQNTRDLTSFILDRPVRPKLSLLLNREFGEMVIKEWKSSIFKSSMINRVKKFIPALGESMVLGKGIPGVRSSIVDKNGFIPEARILLGNSSAHVINYNSPGATGAPAFALYLVRKIEEAGHFDGIHKRNIDGFWTQAEAEIT